MAHDKYTAQEPPFQPDYLGEFLSRELRRIENCVQSLSEREDILIVDGTATAVAKIEENIIIASAAANVFVLLPDATLNKGQHYFVKRTYTGTANVIVRATGTDTIEGVGSSTLSAQWQGIGLLSDGTQWLRK